MASGHKDLLTLLDYTPEEIAQLLSSAADHKKRRLKDDPKVLDGRSAVMVFEKPSLRTRMSFETAIYELGGHPVNLDQGMVGLGSRESIGDVARNLERWVHLIVFRTFSQERIAELARNCRVPVINALTDSYHPCQALAFGQTLYERTGGSIDGSVVFVGDGNNVCCSLMNLCASLGHDFTVACAPGYEPPEATVTACRERASSSGATISIVNSPVEAVASAAAVYTDVWASMGQEGEKDKRARDFEGFQINAEMLSHAPANVLVSHCLPAHRGEEITDDVLDSAQCMAFDEAENRMHAQKAVISHLFT